MGVIGQLSNSKNMSDKCLKTPIKLFPQLQLFSKFMTIFPINFSALLWFVHNLTFRIIKKQTSDFISFIVCRGSFLVSLILECISDGTTLSLCSGSKSLYRGQYRHQLTHTQTQSTRAHVRIQVELCDEFAQNFLFHD